MKHLLSVIFIGSCLIVSGQSTKSVNKKKESISSDDSSFKYLEEEKEDQGYFQQFNSRVQYLYKNGVSSNEVDQDPEIQNLVEFSESNYKNSYEYNMMQYHFNGKTLNEGTFLLKAYEMDPNTLDPLDEMLEYATWKNDMILEKELASKIRSSRKYDTEIYNYSEDLLASIPNGAILVTNGEIETITGKVLQLNDGLYKSITILRKDWLLKDRFSIERLNALGLSYSFGTEDLKPNIKQLIESNPHKEFFLSLTLPKADLEYLSDKLYLEGLAYRYSSQKCENLKKLSENWKNIYHKKDLKGLSSSPYGKKLLSNYLLSGIKLYFYHLENGENTKAQKLKNKLYEMALISGHSEKLKAWL